MKLVIEELDGLMVIPFICRLVKGRRVDEGISLAFTHSRNLLATGAKLWEELKEVNAFTRLDRDR